VFCTGTWCCPVLAGKIQGLVEDALVEKHQGIHGLILGGGGNFALQSEVGEERLDLGFGGEEVNAEPHVVEPGEASDPFPIGALRVDGVMLEPEDPPDLLDQGRWGTVLRIGHKKISVLVS